METIFQTRVLLISHNPTGPVIATPSATRTHKEAVRNPSLEPQIVPENAAQAKIAAAMPRVNRIQANVNKRAAPRRPDPGEE